MKNRKGKRKNGVRKKRYDGYQVADGRQVSELTEEEAKIELAIAMDTPDSDS